MEEPTAGVDIGAKEIIHAMLRGIVARGAAVLIVSSDFEEVAMLCGRALVMGRGVVTAELVGDALNLENLLTRSSSGSGLAVQTH
jgi:ribose transport system ATP-binding protein